jgi:hypothetical protein
MIKVKGWKGQFKLSMESISAHNKNKEFPTPNEAYNNKNKLGSTEERQLLIKGFGNQKATKDEIAAFIIGNNEFYEKYWLCD